MLKFVLPDKTKHSFECSLNISMKEIFQNFCVKKGLLVDMYEIYDPKKRIKIDDEKSPKFYKLKKIYVRRVKEPWSSTDDCLEKSQTDQMEQFYPSLSSRIQNDGDNLKNYVNTNAPIKRRVAPLAPEGPPVNLSEDPDIEIPSPPAYSNLQYENVQYFPWTVNVECNTDLYLDLDDPTYASLFENISPDYHDLSETLDKSVNATLPLETKSYDKKVKPLEDYTYVERLKEDDHVLSETRHSSVDFSDAEEHVYSIISRKSKTVKDNNIENSNNRNSKNYDKKETKLSSIPILKLDNINSSLDINLSKKKENISSNEERECNSSASENSSIDSPRIPTVKLETRKANSSKPALKFKMISKNDLKPLILVPKPRAVPTNLVYQKSADPILKDEVSEPQEPKTLSTNQKEDLTIKNIDKSELKSSDSINHVESLRYPSIAPPVVEDKHQDFICPPPIIMEDKPLHLIVAEPSIVEDKSLHHIEPSTVDDNHLNHTVFESSRPNTISKKEENIVTDTRPPLFPRTLVSDTRRLISLAKEDENIIKDTPPPIFPRALAQAGPPILIAKAQVSLLKNTK